MKQLPEIRRARTGCLLLAAGLLASSIAFAAPAEPTMPEAMVRMPANLKWMPAPPSMPKGVQIAVLYGDPGAEGPAIVRLKIPPNASIAPHWHPTAENFSVLQGKLFVGMGDAVDKAHATALPPMGFVSLPAVHHHYAYTEGEGAVIELSFYGPFQIHYVNPADDPSRR